ncbi:MAG: NAD(P)/FAD-dependent oxidoreductase, partial [Candidatus Rokuibacteriota bacterium]
GWFWWIPFAGDLTSVGCVLHQRVVKARQVPIDRLFHDMVAACPSVRHGLERATQVTEVHRVANFSYRTAPAVGDRFVAIGDAVTFVDPIFSAGVYIAMQSAELVVQGVVDQFRFGDFRATRLEPCRERIARGTGVFVRLMERYYDPAFMDVFFASRPPPVIGAAMRGVVTMVLAGGAFLHQSLWSRTWLGAMFLVARRARHERRRRGVSVESQLPW